MAKTEVLGIGELSANFRGLKQGMETRVSRAMVVSGGQIIKREAKAVAEANGLRKTGAMIANIAIKREPSAPAGTTQYNLGVRHGAKNLTRKQKTKSFLGVNARGRIVKRHANDPFYWRFAEFGTKKQAATPFLGPALENKRAEAIDAMGARLAKELDKAGKA